MKKILYALRFMTVIPIPYKQDEDMTAVARSLAWFPLVGALIGTVLWGTARLFLLFFSPLTSAFLVTAASLILTGGLHLDGLSDLADGLGGGRDREIRLEIMKDSRIGAFGALTLIIFLILKGLFFFELLQNLSVNELFLLILPPLWARSFAVIIIKSFPTARPGGMGDFLQKNAGPAQLASALIQVMILTGLSAWMLHAPLLPAVMVLLFLVMLIPAAVINRMLKGLTGDCYGALIELSELLSLFLLILLRQLAP